VLKLRAGTSAKYTWTRQQPPLVRLTVVSDRDDAYLRRLAGHVETGAAASATRIITG